MLAVGTNRFAFQYSNYSAPSFTPGTSIVPGASNVEGSWTEVAAAANITSDIYLLAITIFGGFTSTAIKDHLLDIGVDPAGGTSYAQVIGNIVCGQANGLVFYFPLFVKSGSSVAVRIQGSNATAGTVMVVLNFYGQPSHPEFCKVGQYSETIGTITNSGGVSFTPGTSGADGTWVSLGTTTGALWWWQVCVQLSNGTSSNKGYLMDLAVGDGSNKDIIIKKFPLVTGTSENLNLPFQNLVINFVKEVPAGSTIYIRGSCDSAPTSGWNGVAVGIGG